MISLLKSIRLVILCLIILTIATTCNDDKQGKEKRTVFNYNEMF